MIKKGLFILLAAVSLTSCLKDPAESGITKLNKEQEKVMMEYADNNGITYQKQTLYTYNNDYIPILTAVDSMGTDPATYKSNEAILISYTIKDIQNRVVETVPESAPILIYPTGNSGKILGLSWCATYFVGEGGRGKFIIPSTIGYGTTPPSGLESNAILVLDLKVHRRMSETQQINYYIAKNNLDNITQLENGVVVHKVIETNDTTTVNDMVSIRYKGTFINGVQFQPQATNNSVSLATFIPGFSAAIKAMRKGEAAIAILPSATAYGVNGNASIPAYMPLVFELELIDTK